MNRFITILGFSVAVPAFIAIFVQNKRFLLLSAIVLFFICCFLFWIESFLKRNGSFIINFAAFHLHKASRGCIIEEQKCEYERIDKYKWQFSKKYQIKSKSNMLDHFDDRFCWSSDSAKAEIIPTETNQEIIGIQDEEIWTVYSIKFNSVPHGQRISTGSTITNLVDPELVARPFLSVTILPKTKLLRMTVKFPEELPPENPRLEIYASSSFEARIKTEPLSYNRSRHEIEVPPVRYPRANWRYVILWDS